MARHKQEIALRQAAANIAASVVSLLIGGDPNSMVMKTRSPTICPEKIEQPSRFRAASFARNGGTD
jgi:hypothetical protein